MYTIPILTVFFPHRLIDFINHRMPVIISGITDRRSIDSHVPNRGVMPFGESEEKEFWLL